MKVTDWSALYSHDHNTQLYVNHYVLELPHFQVSVQLTSHWKQQAAEPANVSLLKNIEPLQADHLSTNFISWGSMS